MKGSQVVTIAPEKTALHAIGVLVDYNIGALMVTEDGTPIGIVSERDVLRLTSQAPGDLDRVRVEDIMTHDVVYATEEDSLQSAMETMTLHRVRHLPILRARALVGIVSIGDVVNALRREFEVENLQLKRYITGAN